MNLRRNRPRHHRAFSLLEVMIALGIFFMAVFTILALVSNTLRNARALQRIEVDIGMAAADIVKTNKITEGNLSGDFGNTYPDWSWEAEAYEAGTNGLWQVDIILNKRGLTRPADNISILVFSPESQGGRSFGGVGGGFNR
jgi:hypothetical protein